MADFFDSLPPRFIIMCPIGSRLDVAVLSVPVHTVVLQKISVVLAQPVARFVIAEIEQQPIGLFRTCGLWTIKHPFLVLYSPLGSFHHPLRFEPKHEFRAGCMGRIGDRLHPVRKAFPIDGPVACGRSPVLTFLIVRGSGVPSRIKPEYVRDQSELSVAIDHRHSPF